VAKHCFKNAGESVEIHLFDASAGRLESLGKISLERLDWD
jgi:hypothetical protein